MNTQTTTKKCEACIHWKNLGNEGECRRHAPQTVVFNVDKDIKFESRFPVTNSNDWCGDFFAK
jgi:hypothetical protein